MKNEQYLYLFKRIKPYLKGIPDPDEYVKPIGDIWDVIKSKSTNEEESKTAFQVLCIFRRILDAAAERGIEL